LGVGITGSFLSGSRPAQITGRIPHPLIENQLRPIDGTTPVHHGETGVHFGAIYWMRPSNKVDLTVSAGPSIMRVEQDFVTDVTYTQTFPYDTASFQDAMVARERETAVGAHVGAEVGWRLLRQVGVAVVGQYTTAHVTFTDPGVPAFTTGGFHIGGGVRLLF
jgi:hypothetical protein